MALVLNGDGTVTGLAVGGLPDGSVDSDTLASGIDKTSITDSGNATAITISAEEHVGIGVVPESDWSGGYSVLQMGTTGAFTNDTNSTVMGENWKHASGNKYLTTGEASRYYQNAGNHYFQVAPSGSADAAISFTDAMTIDNSGAVTMPAQPAFMVQVGANDQNDMGKDAWTTVAFADERFDQNADFASNTFTAPITGKYQLNLIMRIDNIDTNTSYYQLRFNTSNRAYNCIHDFDGMSTDPTYWNFTLTVLADMDANDTVTVDFLQSDGVVQTDITDVSFFSGYLVC